MNKNRGRILIVDDDRGVVDALRVVLEHTGYVVSNAGTGKEALRRAFGDRPDLILLDVMLPDLDGFEILRRLVADGDVPVIMLTAKSQPGDIVKGMEEGAVYYLPKPFDNEVLLAHIRRALREHPRNRGPKNLVYQVDGLLTIDFGAARLRIRDRQVSLTPTELRILRRLVDSQGQVVSLQELLRETGGEEENSDPRVIKVHVRALRTKLGESAQHPRYIHNVRGHGYLFEPRA